MALKKCKECKAEVSTQAAACPFCGAPVKREPIGCGGAVLIIVALLFAINYFSKDDYTPQRSPSSSSTSTSTPQRTNTTPVSRRYIHETVNVRSGPGTDHEIVRQLVRGDSVVVQETENSWVRIAEGEWVAARLLHNAGVPSDAQLQARGLKWNYRESDDKMGRGKIRNAWVKSLNTVNFDFPYSGSQRATLFLRDHPEYGKDAILQIEQGQFLCGIDRCRIKVRFGNGPPAAYNANEPADLSTTTLFIANYTAFLSNLRKVDRVAIEATFYQEGNRVFEFDISGLQWQ